VQVAHRPAMPLLESKPRLLQLDLVNLILRIRNLATIVACLNSVSDVCAGGGYMNHIPKLNVAGDISVVQLLREGVSSLMSLNYCSDRSVFPNVCRLLFQQIAVGWPPRSR
jgi:hypothetical protein